jgi:hypothetical protein
MEIFKLNPNPRYTVRLIKRHKRNAPIRPIVNWQNVPAYKLAKFVSDI